jgi:periplasmic divalent cation tolerance protein
MDAARVWTVTTTVPSRDDAVKLARSAVHARLAAGAEVSGPAVSVFWHLDELGEGEEWRVSLRTSAAARDALAMHISKAHPWSSPEVSAAPLTWCLDTYAEWVERTVPVESEPEA